MEPQAGNFQLSTPVSVTAQNHSTQRSNSVPCTTTILSPFSAYSESRDAIKKLYSVWEKKAAGYVYVNKEKDVMFFGGASSGFLVAYNH